MAGPRSLRGSPRGSGDSENKVGSREAEKAGPPVAPAGCEGTPLPGRPSPAESGAPSALGSAGGRFRPRPPRTHPGTAAEDAPAEGIQKEPRPPPEPGPAGLSSLRPAAGDRGQYPGTSCDPETLGQEVTSFGGGPKERLGRGCALGRGEAVGRGRWRKKREAEE